MLKNIIKDKNYGFFDEAISWEDAIKKSCEALVDNGVVSDEYSSEIIECVRKYGPYIVIEPGIAMPHSTEQGKNVFDTKIAFTKFKKPVKFDETSEASVFFTLASKDPQIHIENMQNLMEVLINDELKEELFKINSLEELKELSNKYNI